MMPLTNIPKEWRRVYRDNGPITKYPAQILEQPANAVKQFGPELRALAAKMERIMNQSNGVGIAAPQINVGKRVAVINARSLTRAANIVLVNPVIDSAEGEIEFQEGCLSIPGIVGVVKRAQTVNVKALDLQGKEQEYELKGALAVVAQHEIDHLDGILFIQRAMPDTLEWLPRK